MALSVWVKWRIAASALMLAVFFVLPGFGEIAGAILGTQWGKLLNLRYVLTLIWTRLFRIPLPQIRGWDYDGIPLWTAWASVFAVCIIAVMLLNRRFRAREVERGRQPAAKSSFKMSPRFTPTSSESTACTSPYPLAYQPHL